MTKLDEVTRAVLVAMHPEMASRLAALGEVVVPAPVMDQARDVARAAINALWEPTQDMVYASFDWDESATVWKTMLAAVMFEDVVEFAGKNPLTGQPWSAA